MRYYSNKQPSHLCHTRPPPKKKKNHRVKATTVCHLAQHFPASPSLYILPLFFHSSNTDFSSFLFISFFWFFLLYWVIFFLSALQGTNLNNQVGTEDYPTTTFNIRQPGYAKLKQKGPSGSTMYVVSSLWLITMGGRSLLCALSPSLSLSRSSLQARSSPPTWLSPPAAVLPLPCGLCLTCPLAISWRVTPLVTSPKQINILTRYALGYVTKTNLRIITSKNY